ncbi:MAG TPA: hypothetical protein DET40_09855 [Lentisphaeria bacterium]|nr:MAG: hypothetical protein A2X45_08640 [Lentisphaerae bacterium GWF2_50_93]HCE43839.1 hypothetical protein [Lentisphaeria bacterium]
MKLKNVLVYLIIFICPALPAYSQDYAVKPAWWDSTSKVTIEKANNLFNSFHKSLEKNRTERAKSESWMEIGPFERNGDGAFDTIYPPEKEIKLDGSYAGKEGKQVAWVKWPAGEKSPISQDISEAVFFFYTTVTVQKPVQKFLIFSHDDGAEVRLNGKQIFINKFFIDPNNPDIVPLDLKAGKNEILVKLDQGGGPWGLAAGISDVSPTYIDIRLMTELLKAFPSDIQEVNEMIIGRLINGYAQIHDNQNMLFWIENLFKRKTQVPTLRKLLEDCYNICQKDEKMLASGREFFKKIYDTKSYDDQVRGLAVKFMFEMMLKKEEYEELVKFIDTNYADLKDTLGNDRFFYKLRAYIGKSDYENSKNTIKDMELIPEIKDKPELKDLRRRAETLKTTAVMVKNDWELNSNIENANKLNGEKNTLKLNRFIQNILISKNASLLETNDKNLLTGAVPRYKEEFKAFEKDYSKSLEKYFEILGTKKGSLSEIQARKRKVLLGFAAHEAKKDAEPPVAGVSEISVGDADKYAFRPMSAMNPGYMEMLKNDNVFTGKVSYSLNCSSSVFKDMVFMQNSRQITCINGDKVLWNRQFDNSVIVTDKEKIPENTPIFTGAFSPKTNGSMVYTRLISDGKFSLFAFDCADGHTVWDMQERDYAICSDPVLYQDQILVLAKKPELITQYFLLVLNAANGNIEDEIYLFSGEEITPLGGLQDIWAVRLDLFMPEPSVMNGRAYISTNSGIIFCVDMEGDFIVWTRKYSRVPFIAQNMDLAYVLGRKKKNIPAVGTQNVLFAPVDAPGLILLNKDTGAVVAESSSIKALDIRKAGPDSVLIIDKTSAAGIYSLARLEPVKALAGADYTYLEKLKDGFILSEGRNIEIWTDAGALAKKIKLPPTFIPISVSRNGIFGYEPGKIKPIIGVLTPQAGKYPEPSCVEKNVQKLNNPQIIEENKSFLIKADNYIVLLDNKLFTEWAVPLRSKNTTVLSSDKVVYLVSKNTIVAIDRKTGAILNRFPKEGETYRNYAGPAIFAQTLYVGEVNPQSNKTQILIIDGAKNEYKGMLNTVHNMLSIYNQGDIILTGTGNVLIVHKFNKETSIYDKTDKNIKLGGNIWEYRKFNIDGKPTLFVKPNDCFTFDPLTSTMTKFPTKNWPHVRWDWNMWDSGFNVVDKIVCCAFQQHVWSLLDLDSRTDLSNNVNFHTSPVGDSSNLLGLVVNDMSKPQWEFKYSAVCFDIKGKNIVYKQDVSPYANLNNMQPRNDLNFLAGDKSFHFFHPTANREMSEENTVIIQDYKNKKVETKSFPGYSSCPDAISANGNVLLMINSTPKVFSIDNFIKFTDKIALIFDVPVNTKTKYDIDGYPDEWDLSKFHNTGKASFYATIDKDSVIFAGMTKDEGIIKKIGAAGLENCMSISMIPGSTACFRTDNNKSAGFTCDFSQKVQDFKFEYSISPSGDFCFFEMSIPLKAIFHVDPNWIINAMKGLKSRDIRGDIAFSFTIADDKKAKESLFSVQETIPLYYPRIKFLFDQKKP